MSLESKSPSLASLVNVKLSKPSLTDHLEIPSLSKDELAAKTEFSIISEGFFFNPLFQWQEYKSTQFSVQMTRR